jgi:hypothetical protein
MTEVERIAIEALRRIADTGDLTKAHRIALEALYAIGHANLKAMQAEAAYRFMDRLDQVALSIG